MKVFGIALTVIAVLLLVVAAALPAHAAGKPVPRKLTMCQAASVHGTYRWQCQHPALRPSAWDLAGWR